jgi:hypothetical protein
MTANHEVKKLYISTIIVLTLWLIIFFTGINANCRTEITSGFHWIECTEMSIVTNSIYDIILTITVASSLVIITILFIKIYFKQK